MRLCTMPLNVKFKSKIFLPALRYAAQQGVNSVLCRIAQSCNSMLCGIAWSQPICANFSANLQPYAKIF
jgi:hypothetical protein